MGEYEKAYLKCNYQEGMFCDEFYVNFKGSFEKGTGIGNDYIVMKKKVVIQNQSSGLLKILIVRKDEETSQVLIDGAMDVGAGEFFKVPNEEIVYLKKKI